MSESSSTGRHLTTRTTTNALWNVAPFGWSFALNLIALPIVVHRLSVGTYGVYALFAVVLAPMTLATMGFGEATVKFVAEHAYEGNFSLAARYVRTTLAMNLIVGALGALVLILAGPLAIVKIIGHRPVRMSELELCFAFLGTGWFANQGTAVLMGVLPALFRYRTFAVLNAIISACTVGAGVGAVVAGTGLVGYTAANAAGAVLGSIVWYMAARRQLHGEALTPSLDREIWRRSFAFGGWQSLAQLGGILAQQSERVLLGSFLSTAAIGYYNIAQNLEQKAYSSVLKMSEVLFPLFSAMSSASAERRAGMLLRASWLLTLLSTAVLAPLIPLAHPLLEHWMGDDVAVAGTIVLQTLALQGILGCSTNATFYYLLGVGRTRANALITLSTGVTTVILASLLIPRMGLPAAGLGGLGAMFVQQLVIVFLILPQSFGSAVRKRDALIWLQSPVIIAAVSGVLLAATHWFDNLSLATTLLEYPLVAVAISGVVILCGVLLPGRAARIGDLTTIAAVPARLAGLPRRIAAEIS